MEKDKKELEKLDLNKLEAKEGVLTIQHQTLPTPHQLKLHEEEAVVIYGTISAPANFYTKRTVEINNSKSHVLYNYRERKIKLTTIEDYSEKGSEIEGALIVNPAIKQLGVNQENTFFVSDMVKHLRKNKFYFENPESWKKVIDQLQNFSANVSKEIVKVNTQNGNIQDVKNITVKSNLELNFKLKMPVFIGEKEEIFPVEIACDADSAQIKFWLESPDLIMLLDQNTKVIIDAQLKRLEEDSKNELVFIEQ